MLESLLVYSHDPSSLSSHSSDIHWIEPLFAAILVHQPKFVTWQPLLNELACSCKQPANSSCNVNDAGSQVKFQPMFHHFTQSSGYSLFLLVCVACFCCLLVSRRLDDRQSLGARTAAAQKKNRSSFRKINTGIGLWLDKGQFGQNSTVVSTKCNCSLPVFVSVPPYFQQYLDAAAAWWWIAYHEYMTASVWHTKQGVFGRKVQADVRDDLMRG